MASEGAEEGDGEEGDEDFQEKVAGRKVTQLRTRRGTRHNFTQYFVTVLSAFLAHQMVMRVQDLAYQRCMAGLPEGHCFVQLDFAMNHAFDHLEETQSEFFSKAQATLLPAVVWINIKVMA